MKLTDKEQNEIVSYIASVLSVIKKKAALTEKAAWIIIIIEVAILVKLFL